jgi:SNF2 family DNA or RNA helicase
LAVDEYSLNLQSTLRPYQWQGVWFLLGRSRALLADQMGLGKTVQVAVALSLLFRRTENTRALIVTPASLRLNWEQELERWSPDLSVRRLSGDAEDRRFAYLLPYNVLVASYDQLRTDAFTIPADTQFEVVVLDEAQRVKNVDSNTALACRILYRNRSWALTGTPLENRVDDLLSIYQFVQLGLLNAGMARRELLDRIQPSFLRRRKADVLSELPAIITQDVPLELGLRQREAYDRVWNSRHDVADSAGGRLEMQLFALITKLKQICNYDPASGESVKLDALQDIADDLSAVDDKVIVFSQYVATLNWISAQLPGHLTPEVFHGGLSDDEREAMLQRFRRGPGPRVLLMSLRAAGTGLNIQEASTVVLFDRWWNPALEAQAVNRAHRFGRSAVLQVFRFLVADSIESRIAEVLATKSQLFDDYVEAAEGAEVPSLSRGDLLRILGLNTVR